MMLCMARIARVLAALKRDGWNETRRPGSHRVRTRRGQQRIWAYYQSSRERPWRTEKAR
jgi:predicted RNA binding protein YcfA (HicA-like mRNA interferase family)